MCTILKYMHFLLVALLCCSIASCQGRPGTSTTIHIEKTNSELFTGEQPGEPLKIELNKAKLTIPETFAGVISIGDSKQPVPADGPATTSAGKESAQADSGNGVGDTETPGLAGSMWAGICIFIAGLFIFAAKATGYANKVIPGPAGVALQIIKQAPKGFGIGLMLLGGGLIILPWLLETVSPIIYNAVYVVAAVALAWWIWNIIQHEKKQAAEEKAALDKYDQKETDRIPSRGHA